MASASGESLGTPSGDRQGPREIKTILDVEALLDSSRAGFAEAMDCVGVARAHGRWDLRHRSAERAYAIAVDERAPRPRHLSEAVDVLVRCRLHEAPDVASLPVVVAETRNWLQSQQTAVPSGEARDALTKLDEQLAELLLLCGDDTSRTLLMLSSKLRNNWERSDLAVAVATRALDHHDVDTQALTTRGAAFCDLGEYPRAIDDLQIAVGHDPTSSHALTALSRAVREAGDPRGALEIAERAISAAPDSLPAANCLAAAAARVDLQRFDEAIARVAELTASARNGNRDQWMLVLAAEVRLDVGQLDEAKRLLSAAKPGARGDIAKRIGELDRRLRRARAAAQGVFDLSGHLSAQDKPGSAVSPDHATVVITASAGAPSPRRTPLQ